MRFVRWLDRCVHKLVLARSQRAHLRIRSIVDRLHVSPYPSSDDISSLDAFSDSPTSVACLDPSCSSVPYRPAHEWKVLTLSILMRCRTCTEIRHSSGGEPRKVQHTVPETGVSEVSVHSIFCTLLTIYTVTANC